MANAMCFGQTDVKVQVSLGYLEHFSIGPTFQWNDKNTLGIYYGSNFFYKPQDFSTCFGKYNRAFPTLNYTRFIPAVGLKAGYSIFTDAYYRWTVLTAVPMVGVRYVVNEHMDLVGEMGMAFSRIESVTRVHYGKIGKYKRYLPELSISLNYSILKRSRD